jgi:hypothetical protein
MDMALLQRPLVDSTSLEQGSWDPMQEFVPVHMDWWDISEKLLDFVTRHEDSGLGKGEPLQELRAVELSWLPRHLEPMGC